MNLALKEELRRGRPVFPMLEVAWSSRGYDLGTARYARGSAIMLDGGPVKGLVPLAGFREARYGPGMKGNTLVAARTSVKVIDVDRSLRTMLETYDPRGSVASVRWVSPFLTEADFEPIFMGQVDDWKISADSVDILLKTVDGPLHSPGPKPMFSRSDWGTAFDPTVWGTAMPLVTGIHDSYKVTARGMVPAVNIKWNEDLGLFWWCASIGHLKTIPRIYYDGTPKESGFTVIRGTYGGVYQTIISVDSSNVPFTNEDTPKANGAAVVSFDCYGPDANGGGSGDSVTNPITQVRAFLNNYVFRDNRTAKWLPDVAQIHTASWDAVEAYFETFGYEGAIRLGGFDRDPALKAIESLLKSKRWLKAWWTPTGQIALAVIPHRDPNIDAADWLNTSTKVAPKDFALVPGDRGEVKSGIIVPYLYSHAEQKYLGFYEAHDLSVLPPEERATDEIEDEFSQGRYDRD